MPETSGAQALLARTLERAVAAMRPLEPKIAPFTGPLARHELYLVYDDSLASTVTTENGGEPQSNYGSQPTEQA